MPDPAAIVRELHQLWRHATNLQREIERGPQRVKAQQAKVGKQEDVTREAQEAVKRLKVSTHAKEVSLKEKLQLIAKHERQLNEASSKKEYDALKHEIGAENQACRQLEDEILDLMAETETRTAQVPELEKAAQQAQQESTRVADDIRTRRNELTERLNEVRKQLQETEALLPADVRVQYSRLLAAHGENAMASLLGRTCSACYTEITAQNYNELRQGRFMACKNCGRMLYMPAAEEVAEER